MADDANDAPKKPVPAVPNRPADALIAEGEDEGAATDPAAQQATKLKQPTKQPRTKTVRLNALSMSAHIRNISDQNTKREP